MNDQSSTQPQYQRVHRLTPLLRLWSVILALIAAFALNVNMAALRDIFAFITGEHRGEALREIDQAAQALVGEMGEGIGEKSGTLLAQAVTTLATDAALKMQTQEKVSVDDIRKMARAAKDAIDTQRVGINVRKAIAAEAREQLLREQAANLDKVVKSGGLSEDAAASMRRQILGLAT